MFANQSNQASLTIQKIEDINKLIDKIFLLPSKTKNELKEAWPVMNEQEKEEFLKYIRLVLSKQEDILKSLVKNNPNFLEDLKEFKHETDRKKLKQKEENSVGQESLNIKTLEENLQNL